MFRYSYLLVALVLTGCSATDSLHKLVSKPLIYSDTTINTLCEDREKSDSGVVKKNSSFNGIKKELRYMGLGKSEPYLIIQDPKNKLYIAKIYVQKGNQEQRLMLNSKKGDLIKATGMVTYVEVYRDNSCEIIMEDGFIESY